MFNHEVSEVELIKLAQAGCDDASVELVERYRPLVINTLLSMQVSAKSTDFDDGLAAGTLGLLEAIHRFDVESYAHLGGLAKPYVRRHVQQAIFGKDSSPRSATVVAHDPHQQAIDEAVAKRRPLEDVVPLAAAADECAMQQDDLSRLRRWLGELGEVDLGVLADIYWGDMNQSEVALRLGVSRMAVSKRHARILRDGAAALDKAA